MILWFVEPSRADSNSLFQDKGAVNQIISAFHQMSNILVFTLHSHNLFKGITSIGDKCLNLSFRVSPTRKRQRLGKGFPRKRLHLYHLCINILSMRWLVCQGVPPRDPRFLIMTTFASVGQPVRRAPPGFRGPSTMLSHSIPES